MFALELPGRDGGGGGGKGKKNVLLYNLWSTSGADSAAVSATCIYMAPTEQLYLQRVSTRKTIGNAFNRDPTALKSLATICEQAIACYCRTVQNA